MYEGYLEFSGTEIINAERTEAYVKNLATIAFTPRFQPECLHTALGDGPYRSPTLDDAPWFSGTERPTTDFYGLYPLDITGIDDSTLSATIVENLDDGGTSTGSRSSTRAVRVHGLLVGAGPAGATAGLAWLKEAVKSSDCGDESSCSAGDLRYFTLEPQVDAVAFADQESVVPQEERYGQVRAVRTLSHRWGKSELDPSMPSHVRWQVSGPIEGTVFSTGALARDSSGELDGSGLIGASRVNYVPNPTLRSSTNLWSLVGLGSLDWLATGSFDGDGCGRVTGDPTTGAFLSVLDGEEPNGGASITTTDAVPAGPATFSVFLRSDFPTSVSVSITDASGNFIATFGAQVGTDWARASTSFTLDTAGPLTITIAGPGQFDFDEALLEVGSLLLDYFDAGHASPDYRTAWVGAPDASSSRSEWVGTIDVTRPDSNYRPYLRVLQGSLSNVILYWWTREQLTMEQQLDPIERVLHDVVCSQGPHVLNRWDTSVGSYIEVDLIFVATNPHPYSNGTPVSTYPIASRTFTDHPVTPQGDAAWLIDPNQPVITVPPRPPVILDPSLESYSNWERYYVSIPASAVQEWGNSVPVLGIDSHRDISQVRIRFHPNPFSYPPEQVDPTSYCSEVIVSYLPTTTRLVLDGMNRRAIASKGGKPTVPADHLLYGSGGGPIAWPELSCGIPYVLTIDIPRLTIPDAFPPPSYYSDAFDLDLVMKRRG
jgi:hypothetical protein